MPKVVGLLGGIGSGKSAVAAELAKRGAKFIVADDLGHEALRQPEIRAWVVARWGRELLDAQGEINRRALGAIVFSDPAALRELEAKVHPYIGRRAAEEIARARAENPERLVVLDAALLLEAKWDGPCDRLVFVDAAPEVRLARVRERRGWSEQDLRQREEAQLPLTEKRARADDIIENSTDLTQLGQRVDELLRRWERNPGDASQHLRNSPQANPLAGPPEGTDPNIE